MMWALLCGGQGRLTAESFALFNDLEDKPAILATATDFLGEDVLNFYQKLSTPQRAENQYNQFFSVLYALSMFDYIKDVIKSPYAVAGYSVGEIAALQITGVLSPAQSLNVTWQRAKIMNESCPIPCQLAFVMGVPQHIVEMICQQHDFYLAIKNPGQFYVLGGKKDNITKLIASLHENGAKRAEALNVMIASHTPYLSSAVTVFNNYLKTIKSNKLADNPILFTGLDGGRAFSADVALQKTAKALATTLDWHATIESLLEQGVRHVLDIGPGNALSNMIRSNYPELNAHAANDFHSLIGLKNWFSKQ